ncbi:unnamed protein product [Fusarium graminearum]|nr:unnamed protein product [Fusarium graminearum]
MRGLTLWQILIIAISLCEPVYAKEYRVQDAPECAMKCLDKFLERPIFSDASIERLCNVTTVSDNVLVCVRGGCSVKDLLGLDSILGILILAKLTQVAILVTWSGLGHDIWTISEETTTRFFIYLLVVEFTYVLSLCLIKLSILFFFLRIFPDPTFITIIRWTIALTILSTTIILVLAALQSAPTEPSQEGWDGFPNSGPRLDIQALILSHAGINVALDIWMFVLPLTQLYNLGLKARKKIGIMLIFGVGIFLIAVSCIRIPHMLDFNRTLNATSDSQGIIIWSNIEIGVGIFVACMPHTQPLLHAAKTKIKWLNILPSSSNSTQGIFVDRSLVPIKMTVTGTTAGTAPEDLVLYDRGGLLSADRPENVKKASHRLNGVETV